MSQPTHPDGWPCDCSSETFGYIDQVNSNINALSTDVAALGAATLAAFRSFEAIQERICKVLGEIAAELYIDNEWHTDDDADMDVDDDSSGSDTVELSQEDDCIVEAAAPPRKLPKRITGAAPRQ